MDKPTLIVIAGCNGSGKSSFSKAIAQKVIPFDYDKVYLNKYKSLIPTEFTDRMAHNMAMEQLENSISESINSKKDFCYETNFNSTPLYWPELFKNAGYRLELVFFCLDSIDKAKQRVRIRYENGGHFVPDSEVEERYFLGFKNLNAHWGYFDVVHLFETSKYNSPPEHIITIEQQDLILMNDFPNYLSNLIPKIEDKIKNIRLD